MCHEHDDRTWVWKQESETVEDTEESDDELPEFLREEAATETELVTDGGDEAE